MGPPLTLAEQQEALTQKYVRQAQDRERAVEYNRQDRAQRGWFRW